MKIVGFMVVGRGEADRWLSPVLEQRKQLVDDMVIVGNNTDEKTEKLIKKFGFWFYRDNREWGIYQPQIKQELLKRIGRLQPDWILSSDADELYDSKFDKNAAKELAKRDVFGYQFAVINLWDDEQHYNHNRSFWNVRYWNYRKAKEHSLNFELKNVHCGLAPRIVYKFAVEAPYLLIHYGLMKPEDRRIKVERYKKYDPKHKFLGTEYYESIDDTRKTRDLIRNFSEDEMHQRIVEDVKKHGKKIRPI